METLQPSSLTVPLRALFSAEVALSSTQMLVLLRNLLQLPRELAQLLALLSQTEGETAQTVLKLLLSEKPEIPLEAFQLLLQTQGQQAQEKLLKLLQGTPMGFTQSGHQLGEVLQHLSTLTEQSSGPAKGMEALQNTLALYLPYYPLQPPQQFLLKYQPDHEGENGQAQEGTLIIFLQTITLGALKVTVTLHTGTPEIVVEHRLQATLQTALERQIRGSLQAEQLPHAQILFLGQPAEGNMKPNNPNSGTGTAEVSALRQEVSILPGQKVQAIAILAAYAVIRAVFELDGREHV